MPVSHSCCCCRLSICCCKEVYTAARCTWYTPRTTWNCAVKIVEICCPRWMKQAQPTCIPLCRWGPSHPQHQTTDDPPIDAARLHLQLISLASNARPKFAHFHPPYFLVTLRSYSIRSYSSQVFRTRYVFTYMILVSSYLSRCLASPLVMCFAFDPK